MKFGIQLWSVRDALKEDFKGTLEALSKMEGFKGLEFAFFYGGLQPVELADSLGKSRWEVGGVFDHFRNFTNPESEAYAYAKALKCKYLISSFPEKELDGDLDKCLSVLDEACNVAAAKGVTICYHGHPFDYADRNGKCHMDAILEVRRAKLVPDTGWITHAGKDPLKFMEQNAGRIPIIHLKDTKADKTITELGEGVVNLPEVLAFAAAGNVEWLNYEQDSFETTSLDGCKKSHDYLKRICKHF